MFFERKTKTQNILKSIWFPFLSLGVFFSILGLFGPGPAFYTLGGIYFLASIFPIATFLKTRNNGYLAVALFLVFAGLVCISAPPAIDKQKQCWPDSHFPRYYVRANDGRCLSSV